MSELVPLFPIAETPRKKTEPAESAAARAPEASSSNSSVRPLSVSEQGALEDALEDASEMLADDLCAALLSESDAAREDAQKLLPLLAWGGPALARVEAAVFGAFCDAGRPKAERLRLAAAWKAALFDRDRQRALENLLASPRSIDRQVALVALSAPGCASGGQMAREALSDVDEAVRMVAFSALLDCGLREDVNALLAFAAGLEGEHLEPHLGEIIDLCSAAQACAFLESLLDAPCAHQRRLALMGHLIRPLTCATPLAIKALDDDDERCRMLALSLLERDGTRPNLEAVLPLLGDSSPRVAAMARDVSQVLRRPMPSSVG